MILVIVLQKVQIIDEQQTILHVLWCFCFIIFTGKYQNPLTFEIVMSHKFYFKPGNEVPRRHNLEQLFLLFVFQVKELIQKC